MQEIDIVYRQDNYTKEGVIVRENEVVTYSVGPRDMGGAETFSIGVFLENPPDYVPGNVVRQVEDIVAGFDETRREKVRQAGRAERHRLEVEKLEAEKAQREAEANTARRKKIWSLPDPWRGTPAESPKPWWKFW